MYGRLLHSLLEHDNFLKIDISPGSVATRLICGGIFNNTFATNLLVTLTGIASYGVLGHVAPSTSDNLLFQLTLESLQTNGTMHFQTFLESCLESDRVLFFHRFCLLYI